MNLILARFSYAYKQATADDSELGQYLLYKYIDKKTLPGALMEETLLKARHLLASIEDPTASTINLDITSKHPHFDVDEAEELAAKHMVATLKHVQAVFSKLKCKETGLPERIVKAKQEKYDKVEGFLTIVNSEVPINT